MADQSLFAEQTELEIDPNKDYLPELVGEDKKFKTPADLARSVLHKESHISRLERENRELREDLVKRSTVDDLLEKLTPKLSTTVPNSTETTSGEPNSNGGQPNEQRNAISKEDIKRILAEEREAERVQENIRVVQQTMKEALGNDAQGHVMAKTRELGMSDDQAIQLAKTNPTAFLKLMDIQGVKRQEQQLQTLFSPGKSSVNTTQMMTPKPNTGHKTFKEWQEIRRQNPASYHANYAKVHADALALGESFYT